MKTVGWDWDSFAKSYSEIQANVVLYFWAKALQKVYEIPEHTHKKDDIANSTHSVSKP
jgi:hypothetical protein